MADEAGGLEGDKLYARLVNTIVERDRTSRTTPGISWRRVSRGQKGMNEESPGQQDFYYYQTRKR